MVLRRTSILATALALAMGLSACSDDKPNANRSNSVNTDLVALKRMIKLPAEIRSCAWQTGKRAAHGGDWWLAAVLDVGADSMAAFLSGPATEELFETPAGLTFDAPFDALRKLPQSQVSDSGRLQLVTPTYGIAAYASSPLLNGQAIRLSATQVLVLLWTN